MQKSCFGLLLTAGHRIYLNGGMSARVSFSCLSNSVKSFQAALRNFVYKLKIDIRVMSREMKKKLYVENDSALLLSVCASFPNQIPALTKKELKLYSSNFTMLWMGTNLIFAVRLNCNFSKNLETHLLYEKVIDSNMATMFEGLKFALHSCIRPSVCSSKSSLISKTYEFK